MVNPNDPHHAALEAEIIAHAIDHQWVIGEATYHSVMPDPVRRALQRCWDPAALYVRGRADRVAVRGQQCVLFESKTNSGKHLRASIEALPVSHYVRIGVPCLYVYRDIKDAFESAFWTTAMPRIDVVFIPADWSDPMKRYFRREFHITWPEADIQDLAWSVNGSNDPFMLISRDALAEAFVDWRAVFAADGAVEIRGAGESS